MKVYDDTQLRAAETGSVWYDFITQISFVKDCLDQASYFAHRTTPPDMTQEHDLSQALGSLVLAAQYLEEAQQMVIDQVDSVTHD